MIVNFLTHIQEKPKNIDSSLRKQSSDSSTVAAAVACSLAGSHKQRRASSSCLVEPTMNVLLCKNTTATASTSTCLSTQRHQSPSPGPTARRCDIALQHRSRADSTERQGKFSNLREKVVDFDFSHHKSTDNLGSTFDSSYSTAASIHYSQAQRSSASAVTLSAHPTKSCFKHHQSTQVPCSTATPLKSSLSIASSSCYARSASPKYLSNSRGSCRQCGHNKCTRAQSFERDESDFGFHKVTGSRSLSAYPTVQLQRGSCSNLVRQTSTESYCRDDRSSLMGSMQRISLYDAHKMTQSAAQKTPSSTSRKFRNPLKRLRECVSYADVFLEAMGNASTHKNNNSSRYVSSISSSDIYIRSNFSFVSLQGQTI